MQHFSSRGRWAGSWAQLWPKTSPKTRKNKIYYPRLAPYWPLLTLPRDPDFQCPYTELLDCGMAQPRPCAVPSLTQRPADAAGHRGPSRASPLGTYIYIYIYISFIGFGRMFGQSWAQERAQRPRLKKRYINQRKLSREIDSKELGT